MLFEPVDDTFKYVYESLPSFLLLRDKTTFDLRRESISFPSQDFKKINTRKSFCYVRQLSQLLGITMPLWETIILPVTAEWEIEGRKKEVKCMYSHQLEQSVGRMGLSFFLNSWSPEIPITKRWSTRTSGMCNLFPFLPSRRNKLPQQKCRLFQSTSCCHHFSLVFRVWWPSLQQKSYIISMVSLTIF